MRTRTLLLIALAAAVAAAEGPTGDAQIDAVLGATPNGVLTEDTLAQILPQGASARAVLLSPGTGASPLRYAFTAGTSAPRRMRTAMTQTISMGGAGAGGAGQQVMAMPVILLDYASGLSRDDAGGWIQRVTVAAGDVQAHPDKAADPMHQAMLGGMRGPLAQVAGLSHVQGIDARGITANPRTEMPESLPEAMAQQIGATGTLGQVVVLPEAAIGVGGRWLSIQRMEQGGIPMLMCQVHTITARTATSVDLAVAGHVYAAKPDIEMQGMRMVIERMAMGATGTMQLDLASAGVTASTIALKGSIAMKVDAGGTMMGMAVAMDGTTSIGPAAP